MAVISTKKLVPQVVKQLKRLVETYNDVVKIKEQLFISYTHATYDVLQWCDKYKYNYCKVMDIIMYDDDLEKDFWKKLDTKKLDTKKLDTKKDNE